MGISLFLDQASTSQHDGVSSPIAVVSFEGQVGDSSQMVLYYLPYIHSYSDEVAVSPSEKLIALKANGSWNDDTLTYILLIPVVRLAWHTHRRCGSWRCADALHPVE